MSRTIFEKFEQGESFEYIPAHIRKSYGDYSIRIVEFGEVLNIKLSLVTNGISHTIVEVYESEGDPDVDYNNIKRIIMDMLQRENLPNNL
jgi:hypothetical protein